MNTVPMTTKHIVLSKIADTRIVIFIPRFLLLCFAVGDQAARSDPKEIEMKHVVE